MMKCCGVSNRNSISSRGALQVRSRTAGGSARMKLSCALLISPVLASVSFAQAKPAQTKAADADRLGLTCAQILQMTSTAWVAHFAEKAGAPSNAAAPVAVRATTAYGKCYDARTNQLAAALGKSGRGPLMGALGNFRDFQKALDGFTTKDLAVSEKQP